MESDAESPAQLASKAKAHLQELKAFKDTDPWQKELILQRQELRKVYLQLLLLHPYSKESKDAETQLWMHTSYNSIHSYKSRIAALDKKITGASHQVQGNQKGREAHNPPHVEYRRILSQFRQFLAEEEKFWSLLIFKYCKQFKLTEAEATLKVMEIVDVEPKEPVKSKNIFPDEALDSPPTNAAQKDSRFAIFSKLLVCLGDIARYREQYNDGGGRPRAGHEDGPARGGRGGRRKNGVEMVARARNYSRAEKAYEQARLLVPDDGNASHQLAILAVYQKSTFGGLYHYYRALCVRQPYDPAADNLNLLLKRAFEDYRKKRGDDREEHVRGNQRLEVTRFETWVFLLHALWKLDHDEPPTRAMKHGKLVISEFAHLIGDRALPDALISRTVVLALGALWKLRLIKDSDIKTDSKQDLVTEGLIASHILNLISALMRCGTKQLAERPRDLQDANDLAQYITAPFRRTLPALRIASKWLRTNLSYIDTLHGLRTPNVSFDEVVKNLWITYADFFTALLKVFPKARLTRMAAPLDEDVEMSGFSPIKKGMFFGLAETQSGLQPGQSQVHPNEEQLMRIEDLLGDAETVSKTEGTPVSFSGAKFVLKESDTSMDSAMSLADGLDALKHIHPDPPRAPIESDSDNVTMASRTDDDPVRDAFDVALGGNDDEDDEDDLDQIVWQPGAFTIARSPPKIDPQTPSPVQTPPVRSPTSPTAHVPVSATAATTAEDLLNSVLKFGGTAPQAPIMFGSGSPHAPTKSIWSSTEAEGTASSFGVYTNGSPRQQYLTRSPPIHGRSISQSMSQTWAPTASFNHQPIPQRELLHSSIYSGLDQRLEPDVPVLPSSYLPSLGRGAPNYLVNPIEKGPQLSNSLMRAPNATNAQDHIQKYNFPQYNQQLQSFQQFDISNQYSPPVSRAWGNS